MIRGTTPTHIFTLPFDTDTVADLRVSYAQNCGEILVKNLDDVTLSGNTISVTLTQEDTLKFDHNKRAMAQIKVKTHAGDVMSSDVITVVVERSLNDEVL